MTLPSLLTDEDRANLVAYLDGELDARAASALEAKLNFNANNRAEIEALRRTWELLDYLPRPAASPAFTSQTLDRIAVLPPRRLRLRGAGAWGPWLLGFAWAGILLVAALGGFAGGRLWPYASPRPSEPPPPLDEALLRDLHLLENLSSYQHIDDLRMLQNLADPNDADLFGDRQPGS
jgi:hypothetical protein